MNLSMAFLLSAGLLLFLGLCVGMLSYLESHEKPVPQWTLIRLFGGTILFLLISGYLHGVGS